MNESDPNMAEAKKDIDDRTPEGHDPDDERGGGGAGGEAGAMPGAPPSERTHEEGHQPREEGQRNPEDDAPGTRND